MASPASESLTVAHRQQQAQIAAVTAVGMLRLWPLLGQGDDEARTGRWLMLALQLIRIQRTKSANLAGAYLTRYRELELPGVPPFAITPAAAIDEQRVVSSLMATGPQRIRGEIEKRAKLEVARQLPDGADQTNVRVPTRGIVLSPKRLVELSSGPTGAAVRHVRDGARDTTSDVIKSDKRVIGYTRVTDGDPCFWCAMLASRGPVYQQDSFDESNARFYGPGNARAHDHCGCDLRPLYSRTGEDTGEWKRYEAIWVEASRGRSGRAAVKRFRQIYEGRVPAESSA